MENQDMLVLKTWANLGRYLIPPQISVTFSQFETFIESAQNLLTLEREILYNLLGKSNKVFAPLADPLSVDLGTHRWLQGSREENYSDWLIWIIQQLQFPELVFSLFNINEPQLLEKCSNAGSSQITREYYVEKGHEDQSGSIDIFIFYKDTAIIVVEVKKGDAESRDAEKEKGYKESIYKRFSNLKKQYILFILLVTSGEKEEYDGFKKVIWSDVCLWLRRFVAHDKDSNLITKALILAFVGAVEQNLLGIEKIGDANKTIEHIEKFLKEMSNE